MEKEKVAVQKEVEGTVGRMFHIAETAFTKVLNQKREFHIAVIASS